MSYVYMVPSWCQLPSQRDLHLMQTILWTPSKQSTQMAYKCINLPVGNRKTQDIISVTGQRLSFYSKKNVPSLFTITSPGFPRLTRQCKQGIFFSSHFIVNPSVLTLEVTGDVILNLVVARGA